MRGVGRGAWALVMGSGSSGMPREGALPGSARRGPAIAEAGRGAAAESSPAAPGLTESGGCAVGVGVDSTAAGAAVEGPLSVRLRCSYTSNWGVWELPSYLYLRRVCTRLDRVRPRERDTHVFVPVSIHTWIFLVAQMETRRVRVGPLRAVLAIASAVEGRLGSALADVGNVAACRRTFIG